MTVLAYIFLALLALGVIFVLVLFLASLSSIGRYSRIRKM